MEKKISKKKQVKNLSIELERQNDLIIDLTRTRGRAIEQLGYQADRLCMQNVLIDMLIEEIMSLYQIEINEKNFEEIKNNRIKKAQEKYINQE